MPDRIHASCSALLWHDALPVQAAHIAHAPRVSVLSQALAVPPMWQDGPRTIPAALQPWPLKTRVRLAIASARALLAR